MCDINYYIDVQYTNGSKQMRPFLRITMRFKSAALDRSSHKPFCFLLLTGCLYLFLLRAAYDGSLVFLSVNMMRASTFA